MQPDRAELLASAHHEGGHAVTAHALFSALGFLEVFADGSGSFEYAKPGAPDVDLPEVAVKLAAVVAAGALAEARFRNGPADPCDGEGGDDGTVVLLAQVHHEAEVARFEAVARRLARRVLARRWADVERVALALAERGHLGPWELAGLIRPPRPARRVVRPG